MNFRKKSETRLYARSSTLSGQNFSENVQLQGRLKQLDPGQDPGHYTTIADKIFSYLQEK